MDNLFELNKEGIITPDPIILLMKPFEVLWLRDKTKYKKIALKELTFVWASCSLDDSNVWKDISNDIERWKTLKIDLFGEGTKWKPDKKIIEAIEFYKKKVPVTPGDRLLASTEEAMDKLALYLKHVDFTETNEQTGALLHDPKKIFAIVGGMGKLYGDYEKLKKEIKAGKKQNSTVRGGGEAGMFETADSLKGLM